MPPSVRPPSSAPATTASFRHSTSSQHLTQSHFHTPQPTPFKPKLSSTHAIAENHVELNSHDLSPVPSPAFLSSEKIYPVPTFSVLSNTEGNQSELRTQEASSSLLIIQIDKFNNLLEQAYKESQTCKTLEALPLIPLYGNNIIQRVRQYLPLAAQDPHASLNEAIAIYNQRSQQLKNQLMALYQRKYSASQLSLFRNLCATVASGQQTRNTEQRNPRVENVNKDSEHHATPYFGRTVDCAEVSLSQYIDDTQQVIARWNAGKKILLQQFDSISNENKITLPAKLGIIVQKIAEEAPSFLSLFSQIEQQALPLKAFELAVKNYKQLNPSLTHHPATDFILFYELQRELVAQHANPPTLSQLSQTLKNLILSGVPYPSDTNFFLALLENTFPSIALEENEEITENRTHDKEGYLHHLASDQALTIQLDGNNNYEQYRKTFKKFIEYKNNLNSPQNQHSLRYQKLLLALNKSLPEKTKYHIKTLQTHDHQHPAQIQKKKAILDLKHFYELATRSLDQPLSPSEYSTYRDFFLDVEELEVRLLLIKQLHDHQQLAQKKQAEAIKNDIDTPTFENSHLFPLTHSEALAYEDGVIWRYTQNQRGHPHFPSLKGTAQDTAKACVLAEYQLKDHLTSFNIQHTGAAFANILHSHINLLENFETAPAEYSEFFKERLQHLTTYKETLLLLIPELSATPALVQSLHRALAHTSAEIILLGEVLKKNQPLTFIATEINRLKILESTLNQRPLATTQLEDQINQVQEKKAEFHLKLYQYRSNLLTVSIEQTARLSRELKKAPPVSEAALLQEFSFYFEKNSSPSALTIASTITTNIDHNHPHNSSDQEKITSLLNSSLDSATLKSYRTWWRQKTENTEQLARLKKEFQIGLIALQKEERLAQKNGGYPSQLNWSDWLKTKLPGNWSEQHRSSPQHFVLAHQLALHGKTFGDAVKDLGQALTQLNLKLDFTQDLDYAANELLQRNEAPLQALGLTPSQLLAWAKDYPTELQHLATNINLLINLLSRPNLGIVSEAMCVLKESFERATIENTVKEMLLGYREDIPGITVPTPLPTPLIAILAIAEYAPYSIGALNALTTNNLANRLGGFLGSLIPIPGASSLFTLLAGITQVQVEKDISAKLSQQRDMEITISALLAGLYSTGGAAERIKAVATYKSYRDIIKEGATTYRDFVETKPRGFFTRIKKQLSLWWKYTTARNKVTLIVSAIITPIATGILSAAMVALTFGTLGLAPLGIAALIGALGGAAFLTSFWRLFSKRLGLTEVQQKVADAMTEHRIQDALTQLRSSLEATLPIPAQSHLAKQQIEEAFADDLEILKEKLRLQLKEFAKINGGSSKLTPAQKTLLNKMILKFKKEKMGATLQRLEKQALETWIKAAMTHLDLPDSTLPPKNVSPPVEEWHKIAHEIDKQLASSKPSTPPAQSSTSSTADPIKSTNLNTRVPIMALV